MSATRKSPKRAQTGASGLIRRLVVVHGPDAVGRTVIIGDAPLVLGRAGHGDGPLAVDDEELSRQHARIQGDALTDLDSTNGTFVGGRPVRTATLRHGSVIRAGRTVLLYEALHARPQDRFEPESGGLLGPSPAMQRVRGEIARVARRAVSVLILGETGVGKERVAEALHRASRRDGPFVPVNCAALPAELVESELFGHEAGAFSGARTAKQGLFVAASGGTIFLDEIGEMPLPLQPKLLRVLATGVVRPVGATSGRKIDVRVVAATHKDVLESAMGDGAFRSDLYARLAGWVIRVPALRERRADVLPLATHFLSQAGGPATFTTDVAEALLLADWPFNVRGLEQAMTAAAVRVEGSAAVDLPHIDQALGQALAGRLTGEVPIAVPIALQVPRDQAPDAEQLRRVLSHFGGNVAQVAAFFGKDRRQIYRWADRLDVDVDAARDR